MAYASTSGYAGAWIDNVSGVLHVGFTAAATASSRGGVAAMADDPSSIRQDDRKYSLADLQSVMAKIPSLISSGAAPGFDSASLMTDKGQVGVGVKSPGAALTDQQRSQADASLRSAGIDPAMVVVGPDTPSVSDSDVSNDGAEPPYTAGIEINDPTGSCTMGWGVYSALLPRTSTPVGVLTAGHCFPEGGSVTQGPHPLGQVYGHSRHFSGTSDVEEISAHDFSRLSGRTFTTWPNSAPIIQVQYANNVGDIRCFSGYRTGFLTCGTVTASSVTRVSTNEGNVVLNDMVQTNANSMSGDSGAPVFAVDASLLGEDPAGLLSGQCTSLCVGGSGMYFSKIGNDLGALDPTGNIVIRTQRTTGYQATIGVVGTTFPGLWKLDAAGFVNTVGATGWVGDANAIYGENAFVGGDRTSNNGGYWVVARNGCVFPYGNAIFRGQACGLNLKAPISGMSANKANGAGYYLVGLDGGVFAFNLPYYGNAIGQLGLPAVAIAARPQGGYWVVSATGGVFSFGAPFYGSLGGLHLTNIVGITSTPTGNGYWLVGSDGGVFAFGDARFLGSLGGLRIGAPITGMATTGTGAGYWLTDTNGFIYRWGDALCGAPTNGANCIP